MKSRKAPALLLLLVTLINCFLLPSAAVDGGKWVDSLQEKTLLILGDSYCAGYGLARREDAWPYEMASRWNMKYVDHAISGSTFAAGPQSSAPMVERVREIAADPVDIIVVQGSSNDWSHNIPVGELDSRDPETAMGALNVILDTLAEAHPEAKLLCFTPWISNGTENDLGLETTAYHDAMLALCESRNIPCYDAADTENNGIEMDQPAFRSEYCLTSTDRWHMNPKGQAMFAPIFARWLQETLYGPYEAADQFADLIPADDVLRQAVGLLTEQGIMNGISERLFAPARAATRETLAVTLYRMAGSPESGRLEFSDVMPDQGSYPAICWAVSQGLMEGEGQFFPARSLTRQELAAAIYRYDTQIAGEEITALSGLGHYPDRDQLADSAAAAFSWALQEQLLLPENGLLRPQSAVSRGQLAQVLAILWNRTKN